LKSIILFTALSLLLMIATVATALINTVKADEPIYKYCIDGGPFCGEKKADCKDLLEGTADDHKCLEVRIG
jgi:hypothetical protein